MSPVPIGWIFYGEKESDNQIIDLYRTIMISNQKSFKTNNNNMSKSIKINFSSTYRLEILRRKRI